MADRICENAYRTTMIFVDSFDRKVMKGRFYNPYMESREEFESLMDLLIKLENLLDRMRFPDSSTVIRSFGRSEAADTGTGLRNNPGAGALATFSLRILFRQNSSWQGVLVWLEGRRDRNFRSTLEMILLMNDALSYGCGS